MFEKSLAFFPLLPFLMHILANSILLPLQAIFHYHLVLILSGVALNLILFPIAAFSLFEVSCTVLRDHKLAYTTALLFCFNPASIFFSAIYSETLFSCLVFTALHYYHKHSNVMATLLFFLAACARSNGAVNSGFAIYNGLTFMLFVSESKYTWTTWIVRVFTRIFQSLIVIFGFVIFQYYAYKLFCEWPPPQFSKSVLRLTEEDPMEYVVRGQHTEWCSSSYPLSYAYVQERYWNVGFLRYFQFKQIPNFMLMVPAVVLCSHGIFQFASQILKTSNKIRLSRRNVEILPYIIHCSFLLISGIASLHVQVRFQLLMLRFVTGPKQFFFSF